MKVSSQLKGRAWLRIFAGTGALVWLAGIAVCGLDRECHCATDGGPCASHGSRVSEPAAVSQPDDGKASPGHCGKNGCAEQCRCSTTIYALMAPMSPVVISKPDSQPPFNIPPGNATQLHVFAALPSEPGRQAQHREFIFTPEVCLGPAFRSLAPPVSSLS